MSVGVLIITHGDIGQAIYDATVTVIGSSPLRTEIVSVEFNQEPGSILEHLKNVNTNLDSGDGVLVLTDMYGATPSNIACGLDQKQFTVVSWLNLPMLIRLMNYPTLSLTELNDKALSGGQEGIIYCRPMSKSNAVQSN